MFHRMPKIILAQIIETMSRTGLNISKQTENTQLRITTLLFQTIHQNTSQLIICFRKTFHLFTFPSLFIQKINSKFLKSRIFIWVIIETIFLIKLYILFKMKISHDKADILVKDFYYPDIVTRKCIHTISFLCWFIMIFLGTTIIGVGTSNSFIKTAYCDDSSSFCTDNILVNSSTVLYFYVKLSNYHQNNRIFMDSFSTKQLHGLVDNTNHCGTYYTYQSFNLAQTAGGYRIAPTAYAHPCGEVMSYYNVDIIYLVDSQGGTPTLDNGDLVSNFNKNHFKRLSQYQLSQWIDVQSTRFINYFTISATGTKYELLGKASVTPGNYQVVMQNNYLTKGEFTKQLLITEVGLLGATNHVLGFTAFAYGLFLLFLHIYICFRWRK